MNHLPKSNRKSPTRSLSLAIVTASFGITLAQACSDPFESCQERRACPAGGAGGGIGHAGEGGEPSSPEGGNRGEMGGTAGLAAGGAGPSTLGGQASSGGPASGNAGAIGITGGAPPLGDGGEGGSTAGMPGGVGAGGGGSGGAVASPQGGTIAGGGATTSGGAITLGGALAGGGLASSGGRNSSGGGAAVGGKVGSGGESSGWGACTPGETKLCQELFPSISECTQKTVTCMSNSHWPDAGVACVPTPRDCRSANDNNCDNVVDNLEDSFCTCQYFGSAAGVPCNLPGEPDCARGVGKCVQDATTLATHVEGCHLETSPTYMFNVLYCPNNAASGAACTMASGRAGTLRSRCAETPSTCGYLYCQSI
jgi:hypothetical protein